MGISIFAFFVPLCKMILHACFCKVHRKPCYTSNSKVNKSLSNPVLHVEFDLSIPLGRFLLWKSILMVQLYYAYLTPNYMLKRGYQKSPMQRLSYPRLLRIYSSMALETICNNKVVLFTDNYWGALVANSDPSLALKCLDGPPYFAEKYLPYVGGGVT